MDALRKSVQSVTPEEAEERVSAPAKGKKMAEKSAGITLIKSGKPAAKGQKAAKRKTA